MYAGHCATRCGLKEHASRSSSRFGARVASLARRDGANKRGFTSSQLREVWWFRRGRNVSSLARRAANEASTRFVAAWRRAASMRDRASAVRAGRALALAVTSGLRVVYPSRHRRDARKRTLGPHRNVSRGRGASGGSFASDSRWPENFSLSPLAMRWRRRASRRFWPASCRPHSRDALSARDGSRIVQPIRHRRDARRTPAPRGRRTSSCAPFFWNSRRAAV